MGCVGGKKNAQKGQTKAQKANQTKKKKKRHRTTDTRKGILPFKAKARVKLPLGENWGFCAGLGNRTWHHATDTKIENKNKNKGRERLVSALVVVLDVCVECWTCVGCWLLNTTYTHTHTRTLSHTQYTHSIHTLTHTRAHKQTHTSC